MSVPGDEERGLVQYLLGEAAAAEQEAIQQRILTDEGFDQEVLATADDLIHAYLAGALSPDQRSRFETHFLAMPRHRERFAFVKDLVVATKEVSAEEAREARLSAPSQRREPWRSWAWVAAIVIALASVALLLATRSTELRPREAVASPEPPPSTSASADAGPASPQLGRARPDDVRVVRLPREGGAPLAIAVSPETRVVRVEVPVSPGSPSFDAVVRTRDGADVWHADGLAPPPAGAPLLLTVPAAIFASDRYVLRVEGESLRDSAPPRVLEYTLSVRRER